MVRPWLVLARYAAAVVVAGLLLGACHRWPWPVAALLSAVLAWRVARPAVGRRLMVAGALATALLGLGAEAWGTACGHWAYHGLPPGVRLPAWLPAAWGLAYVLIYLAECQLLALFPGAQARGRFLMALGASLVLPFLGEAAAIGAGVWTYAWPLQLVGVPLLALGLLAVLHGGIYLALAWAARRLSIADPVYGA